MCLDQKSNRKQLTSKLRAGTLQRVNRGSKRVALLDTACNDCECDEDHVSTRTKKSATKHLSHVHAMINSTFNDA